MKFPTLSDDLGKILPVKIRLTQDVKAQYDTKKRGEMLSSWRTLDFILPKGTELTLGDKNKYASLFYTDKTKDGFPIDVFFEQLVGKADIVSNVNPIKEKQKSHLTTSGSKEKPKEEPKDESNDKIFGMPKGFAIGAGIFVVMVGGYFLSKFISKQLKK